jgi:hypothetical protein
MTQSAPTIAQNVLPVMDDPLMSWVPWPIQTTPVMTSTAPTTRLTMITQLHTHDHDGRFTRGDAGRSNQECTLSDGRVCT